MGDTIHTNEWNVTEDGSLQLNAALDSITYHQSLNVLLITSGNTLKVLDVPSGVILKDTVLCDEQRDALGCTYVPSMDRVVYSDGRAVGIRRHTNGALLMDTALHTPITKNEDPASVELLLPEAHRLFAALMNAELTGVDNVEEVLRELEKSIESAQQSSKNNHKVSKWASVCICLPHCILKSVFGSLMEEMKRNSDRAPGLPVTSALYERLCNLLQSSHAEYSGVVDRSQMYSEIARRQTFTKWPHMNYKWALPEQMAQAGFYHQPSTNGDDRALCFTCNVCLVCWEPTDEPWSEHERHSSQCPFVKGEYTHNVPLASTEATQPALCHGSNGESAHIECISTTCSSTMVASSTIHGNIVVWKLSPLKKYLQFNIDPWDSVVMAKTGWIDPGEPSKKTDSTHHEGQESSNCAEQGDNSRDCDNKPASSIPADRTTPAAESSQDSLDVKSCENSATESGKVLSDEQQNNTDGKEEGENPGTQKEEEKEKSEPPGSGEDSLDSKAEVIEVGGAWKTLQDLSIKSVEVVELVEIPLHDQQGSSGVQKRCRPSQDVLVSSMCMLSGTGTSSLVSGVALRQSHISVNQFTVTESNQESSEVQALNQVNEALNSSQIISDSLPNPFIPYIVVHEITCGKSSKDLQQQGTSSGSSGTSQQDKMWKTNVTLKSNHKNKVGHSKMAATPHMNLVQQSIGEAMDLYTDEEDPDIEIVSVTVPQSLHQQQQQQSHQLFNPVPDTSDSRSSVDPSVQTEGLVLQCIALPSEVDSHNIVSSITPTPDGSLLVASLTPRCLNRKFNIIALWGEDNTEHGSSGKDNGIGSCDCSGSATSSLVVYRVDSKGQLSEDVVCVRTVQGKQHAAKSVLMLPFEVGQNGDEEEAPVNRKKDDDHIAASYMAVVTHGGQVLVMRVENLSVVATLTCGHAKDKFVAVTYCSGIDRLCCSTGDGKLYFYMIRQSPADIKLAQVSGTEVPRVEDGVDGATKDQPVTEALLVQQPLSLETLTALHELTHYEELLSSFTGTAPPCWTEIQQEQQQRRHPQHLHRHGEGVQHTRTWRLQQDSTSWEEHLFELVLPKPSAVGHVDLSFQLQTLCMSPPDIEVTLYKQSVPSFGHKHDDQSSAQVDHQINFNLNPDQQTEDGCSGADPLKQENVELLSGPYDLSAHMDLTGHSGVITLTSPAMLKYRLKTLLVHLKASVPQEKQPPKSKPEKLRTASEGEKKSSDKSGSQTTTGIPPVKKSSDSHSSLTKTVKLASKHSNKLDVGSQSTLAKAFQAAVKQKAGTTVGCDWLAEISISFRKNTSTALSYPRMQRNAMLETGSFHEQLVSLVSSEEKTAGVEEHKQKLSLDILIWILTMHTNNTNSRTEVLRIAELLKSSLPSLIKSCFLSSSRSVSRKCASLLLQCMEYTKNSPIASAFTVTLLHALLDCLPGIGRVYSAGSLKWFFTLLNRVKCMDVGKTAEMCADLLAVVARHYSQRTNSWHSLLKARYGLYGNPFDPDLFNMDLPSQLKGSSGVGAISYSSAVVNGQSSTNGAGVMRVQEELDFKDLSSFKDKASLIGKLHSDLVGRHVFGILEVEPLHYTCSASSDGTRIERIDSGVSTQGHHSSALSGGTINFGETLSSQGSGLAASGLSNAAEVELLKLQHKQLQLMKLQQQKNKLEQQLAESKSTHYSFQPYNSELFPPTPKNTPFFMTPPLTPPNESSVSMDPSVHVKLGNKLPTVKENAHAMPAVVMSSMGTMFQPPPAQAVVIERMHSGARRFVVLDFSQPIALTDVIVPACLDLASLSVDVWINNEEVDGQRLVVSTDIGHKTLVLNDLMPPPVCRYLKLTTIGKYGGSTTKSKVPVGYFYGHTFLLPWEVGVGASSGTLAEQAHILSQLSMYVSLQEDIQCRYSLACKRLQGLLASVEDTGHTQYFLKHRRGGESLSSLLDGKKEEEDVKVLDAYEDCINLQQQLNVAQRAISRLQKALGLTQPDSSNTQTLQQASTDKLQLLTEMLLDTLLSVTYASPSIAGPPASLYRVLCPSVCEDLFHHLCIHGTKRIQLHAGLFLVRLCGRQNWWGHFLGSMLQQYFVSQQAAVCPQDRVFLLLVSLAQRSLSGAGSSTILESVLMMLAKLLSPLLTAQDNTYIPTTGTLDVTLVGWLLLFLSKCLDSASPPVLQDGSVTKGSMKESIIQNRWEFLSGETSNSNNKASGKSSPSKLFRRKLQKRIMHQKQELMDFQKAKSSLGDVEKVMLMKADSSLKKSDQLMSWYSAKMKNSKDSLLKQYSSKHFKDAMNLRRTDGEALNRSVPADEISRPDEPEPPVESGLSMDRDKCVPIIRGLVALILSVDFTCHVDLFIVACKVVARISQLARPTLCLSEVLRQEELERLVMLLCNVQYNSGNVSWGGAWAGHAIMCMLQDILEGERLNPKSGQPHPSVLTDDDLKAMAWLNQEGKMSRVQQLASQSASVNKTSETDDSLAKSVTLPTMDSTTLPSVEEENNSTESSGGEMSEAKPNESDSNTAASAGAEDLFMGKDDSFLNDLLMDVAQMDQMEGLGYMPENFPPPHPMGKDTPQQFGGTGSHGFNFGGSPMYSTLQMMQDPNNKKSSSGTKNLGAQGHPFDVWNMMFKYGTDRMKVEEYGGSKGSLTGQGVSTAMDSRLQTGLQVMAEIKLRIMVTMEALRVHNALTVPLPEPPLVTEHYTRTAYLATDDEQISEATLLNSASQLQFEPSSQMLSQCFNSLFMQLPMQRVNLDALLNLWLTLNEDVACEEQGNMVFDSFRSPSVALDKSSIASLLTALAWTPNVHVHTWVLAFQVLCMLCNQKFCDLPGVVKDSSTDHYLAAFIVTNSNFTDVILKFLSNTSTTGTVVVSGQAQNQVGPTVVKAFSDFLQRVRLHCPSDIYSSYKSLLLKLTYTLCSDRGAILCGTGPLDVQAVFIESVLDNNFEDIEASSAVSVIEAVTKLAHQHILTQDRVNCKSSSDTSISARSCFGGLFASVLRGADSKPGTGDTTRDHIVCTLLKLVHKLVQVPLPGRSSNAPSAPPVAVLTTVHATPLAQSNTSTPAQATPQGNTPRLVGNLSLAEHGSGMGVTHPSGQQVDSPLTDLSKITQALGSSAVLTSTPNTPAPKSDDEKGQETDEQKTENVNTSGQTVKSCNHFTNVHEAHTSDPKPAFVCDLVLGHDQTMMHLLQTLAACNSSTMAMILASSGAINSANTFYITEPLSVGDCVFKILSCLNKKTTDINLILRPLHDYISCSIMGGHGVCKLSEPLLWFIVSVLDCEVAMNKFLQMNGVEVICQNLVSSSRHIINTSPSLVATMIQHLASSSNSTGSASSINALYQKKGGTSEIEEGLRNLATLGSITSSSPTASSADVLIQSQPPHRRARSAAWSYHFYPDEAWFDLTLTLPFCVKLYEVHITPHLSSLSTCPSAVSVEASRDGMVTLPMCPPQTTCGLTSIKLQLVKPEVVNCVVIRLHRPLDAMTVGLSQIKLMGTTAFGGVDVSRVASYMTPMEDYVSRTSIGWLRLLHHCLTEIPEVESAVAMAAAPIPHLLVTCSALLVSSSAVVYSTHIEAVLLKIGLYRQEVGLALIGHILRNTTQTNAPMGGRLCATATPSTVDIVYKLGVTCDQATMARVSSLCGWLSDSACQAIDRGPGYVARSGELPPASPQHVQCVAAVLWKNCETGAIPVRELVTTELLRSVFEWATSLPVDSPLKKSLDAVICSVCYINPDYFSVLLEWLGISSTNALNSLLTDDSKDQQQQQHSQGFLTDDKKDKDERRFRSLTDDTKAGDQTYRHTYNLEDRGRGGALEGAGPIFLLQDLSDSMLSPPHLLSLAGACMSPMALLKLLESGFPTILCQALYEFCKQESARLTTESVIHSNGSSLPTSPRSAQSQQSGSVHTQEDSCTLTVTQASDVLRFLAELCREVEVKDWLGSVQNSLFWPPLLNLLCTMPHHLSGVHHSHTNKMLSGQQRAQLESETINFFKQCVVCHSENQVRFAQVLCEIMHNGGIPSGTMSGFMRRLFLQVLLEDEKVTISLESDTHLYKGGNLPKHPGLQHPSTGAGHKYRTLQVSLSTTVSQLIGMVTNNPGQPTTQSDKPSESEKKDASDLGFEIVKNISQAAGLSAQEKRSKATDIPARPPSRRGHRPSDTSAATGSGVTSVATAELCHSAVGRQSLPGELSLAQLMYMLRERGQGPGKACLKFSLRLRQKNCLTDATDPDCIPAVVLLDSPSLTSTIQVFSSVGGLCLLAEHLPILYPEIPRQATDGAPQTTSTSGKEGPAGGVGHDWVTVQSADELLDDFFEPTPPFVSAQNRDSKPVPTPSTSSAIPAHSLVSFGLFLRLPGYADVLLKERRKAQCLLRLVLGVTDDGEGGHILHSPIALALPTLPFTVLRSLYNASPVTTDDGVLLRRMSMEIGVVHLLLSSLSVLSHHSPAQPLPAHNSEIISTAVQAASMISSGKSDKALEEKSQSYWAKGTGFGTGSTLSSWDAEQALIRQRSEEEHVTCLLQVLASFINPGGSIPEGFEGPDFSEEESVQKNDLPAVFTEMMTNSCLVPAICSYLRNDSVLDMSRHTPLYRALLELLRALSVCSPLVPLLLPQGSESVSISELLDKMKACVDTYASRLKGNKKGVNTQGDSEDPEGLAKLIPDIQTTAHIVQAATRRLTQHSGNESEDTSEGGEGAGLDSSIQDRYMQIMKELQFDTYELVIDDAAGIKFTSPHHYEALVKSTGDVNNAARARRLAQEAVTLSTSLPLSYNSSVFVRCDEERLDVMKVLITGPSDTPYANGCFEFDVYFPQDYPNSPPLVNLETTGNRTVRFNPNLYNDGKVCLSVLNTWHGRPEEKWNAQTSSFLQVLVSIQSLILVNEPYFNEPGYERSRGTPSGMASSREYDANIEQATVKWAMLEMLRKPPPCFKEVIREHFELKRHEICSQIEKWIKELETDSSDKRYGRNTVAHSILALKRHYSQLKEEFAKLKPSGASAENTNQSNNNMSVSEPENSKATATRSPQTPSSSSTVEMLLSSVMSAMHMPLDSNPQLPLNNLSVFSNNVPTESQSQNLFPVDNQMYDFPALQGNAMTTGGFPDGIESGLQNSGLATGTLSEHVASMTLGPEENPVEMPEGL